MPMCINILARLEHSCKCSILFYPQSPEVEPWVFRWIFPPLPSLSPHHQLVDAKTTFVYSVGGGGEGEGGVLYCKLLVLH